MLNMTFAVRLTRRWVRLYTAGLPPEARDARRAEIESDLWEHGEENGVLGAGPDVTAMQVLGRLLLGLPADLSWRLEQRGAHKQAQAGKGIVKGSGAMVRILKERWLAGLVVLFAGFTMVFGTSIFVRFFGDGPLGLGAVLFGLVPVAAGALILVGFFISEQAPWKGAALLTIGAVTIPAIHFWMFPIYVPVALVITAFGIARARGFAKERDRAAPV